MRIIIFTIVFLLFGCNLQAQVHEKKTLRRTTAPELPLKSFTGTVSSRTSGQRLSSAILLYPE